MKLNYLPVDQSRAGLSELNDEYIALSLLRETPTVSPQNTNGEVQLLLSSRPDLIGLPVVENNKPIGLINRNVFMDGMAKPYRHELYNRKSCIAFMEKEPLIVDHKMSIQELSFLVVGSGGKTLNDGFLIIDDKGNYLGLGTGEDLVRVVSHLQAEKNRLVMESINYASVIQKSFQRASKDDMEAVMDDYFMHWEPRDKVGGDYYYCKKFDDGFFIALIDCTGHGVPGAFMTLIMAAFLDHILHDDNRHDPASSLSMMNKKVKIALGQFGEQNITPIHSPSKYKKMPVTHESIDLTDRPYVNVHADEMNMDSLHDASQRSDDGMDTAFCWVNTLDNKLIFAGAKTPIFFIEKDATEVSIIEGDRKGVGYVDTPMDYTWTNKEIELSKGICIYLTTDGIIDQIGGAKSIAFGKRRFTSLLLKNVHKPMPEQIEILMQSFQEYQGKQRRRDDVSLTGFRI